MITTQASWTPNHVWLGSGRIVTTDAGSLDSDGRDWGYGYTTYNVFREYNAAWIRECHLFSFASVQWQFGVSTSYDKPSALLPVFTDTSVTY